jgi:hypothetical protein
MELQSHQHLNKKKKETKLQKKKKEEVVLKNIKATQCITATSISFLQPTLDSIFPRESSLILSSYIYC